MAQFIIDSSVLTPPVAPVRPTYNNIVSDELQMELLDLRDNIRNNSFRIGDIAVKVMNEAEKNGLNVSQTMVWSAVGSFVGYSARTIRYYAETALFYPNNIRDKYDILPFSHFVYARYKGERWEEVLEYALDNPGISEAALDYWYRTVLLGEAITEPPETMHEETTQAKPLQAKPVTQPADLVVTLSKLIDTAEQLLYDMDSEGGVIQEVALHVSALKQLLPKLKVNVVL